MASGAPDIRKGFSEGRVTFSREQVTGLMLPTHTVDFLVNVGLPAEVDDLFCANEHPEVADFSGMRMLVVGSDDGTDIVLAESSGEVRSEDRQGALPGRFINTDVIAFSRLLESVGSLRRQAADMPDDEYWNAVGELRDTFDKVDPAALREPSNWWSIIMAQIDEELL